MTRQMKFNLLSREITIKIEPESRLNKDLLGRCLYAERKIVIDDGEGLKYIAALHEIFHAYTYFTGIGSDDKSKISVETACDVFGTCLRQIILENGTDFFTRLDEFIKNEEVISDSMDN
jgi:hypothetical protein